MKIEAILKKKILSVVVSVYNEEQALEECYTEMKRVLDTLSWIMS